MSSRARRTIIVVGAVFASLGLFVVGFVVYASLPYRADEDAYLAAWRSNAVQITGTDRGFVIEPTTTGRGSEDIGLVFIPGARVEPSAYLFRMAGIVAETGMTVVITRPTLNFAILDSRPLETFTADAPTIDTWLVGGHSLGGVRACQWAQSSANSAESPASPEVVGLMLFGSYCADDLSGSGLAVATFVASNDGLSTPEDIAQRAKLLPDDAITFTLEGANHAQFGDYGAQAGDGEATISTDEVQRQIALSTAEFVQQIRD
ncbi:MAG: alpha/beta hydrolase [Microcella sp.]